MHPQKLDAFLKRLRALADRMGSDEHKKFIEDRQTRRVTYGTAFFHLSKVTEPDFNDLLEKMTKEPGWSQRFSVRTLEDELIGAVGAILNNGDYEAYVTAMVERLDSWHPRHRVMVPLSGVVLEAGANFDFGNVALTRMTEDTFESEFVVRFPDDVHVQGVNQSVVYAFNVKRDFDSTGTYATFTEDVDGRKATELIDEYVAPVADYLQYCLGLIGASDRYDCLVDYKGRYNRLNMNAAVVIDEQSQRGALATMDEKVSVRMTIAKADIARLEWLGIAQLARLFGPRGLEGEDEYATLIYRAIRVFAEGERSHSLRQRILSYVTACELFFSQKVETTRAVTEGVAYVAGADYDARKAIIEAMNKMYQARSATTHEGLEPENVSLYRRQILEVLQHMISMRKSEPAKFRTKKDIADWIERQRLSGPPVA